MSMHAEIEYMTDNSEIDALRRELNAALYDIIDIQSCAVCMHRNDCDPNANENRQAVWRRCRRAKSGKGDKTMWTWRGVCEENSGVNERMAKMSDEQRAIINSLRDQARDKDALGSNDETDNGETSIFVQDAHHLREAADMIERMAAEMEMSKQLSERRAEYAHMYRERYKKALQDLNTARREMWEAKAERDAAVRDIEMFLHEYEACKYCKKDGACFQIMDEHNECPRPVWRGACKENGGTINDRLAKRDHKQDDDIDLGRIREKD